MTGADAKPAGARRRLPLGIQTFREIREGGYYYVDKTGYIARLLDEGKHYFLSRPRRFGKSLLLDTIKELFEGNEALFRGLAAEDHPELAAGHPVVRLSFGGGNFGEPGHLAADSLAQLEVLEEEVAVAGRGDTASIRFRRLIRSLHRKTGQRVAVLVDEYDKPILDALEHPEVARANRDFLRGLYGVIKDCDADIRFTLLTGVSRFSKVSLFSGLNNLLDITLEPEYSAICGYTEGDLDRVFGPELPGLDREAIRDWYNGYNWLGPENVYNPCDALLLFRRREFKPYWFETGTPRFLVDTLLSRGFGAPPPEGVLASEALLSAFDVEEIAPEALLFQTGYLTIRETERRRGKLQYRLGYPNREVRQSLNESLLGRLTGDLSRRERQGNELHDLLLAGDFERMGELFRSFFAGIPYRWHTRNPIAGYEGYYASVFQAHFLALGPEAEVVAEDASSRGRVDMAVRFHGNVYLFEFEVVGNEATGAALAQLKAKGYAEKYRGLGAPVHLIGVEFSRKTRNVVAFDAESA